MTDPPATGPRVGLLDSGVSGTATGAAAAVVAARRFALSDSGEVENLPPGEDALGHGTRLAGIVLEKAPGAILLNAQIFTTSFATSAAVAAGGLDWLQSEGVRLVNMSFGLRDDREVLRQAVARALAGGVVLLAASPARGAAVYPAAYDGVLRITGDARCAPGEISFLDSPQADFGTHPRPPGEREGELETMGGASFAVAHATGLAAAFMSSEPGASSEDIREMLIALATYHGPERKGG